MKYVLKINGKRTEFLNLVSAGAAYDNGWARVEFVGVVCDCGCERLPTDQERQALASAADDWSISK